MSGEPIKVQAAFVPPPTGGLNLIAAPDEVQPNEATSLANYLIYDSGIRQVGALSQVVQYANTGNIGFFFPFIDSNAALRALYSNNTKIYRFATDESSVDVTGGAVITVDLWNACYFNKHILLFNGTDTPLTHDIGAASHVAAFSATGPTITTLVQATGYKTRLYIAQKNSTVIWWGDVGAFAGTFTSLDLGEIFEFPGYALCCFNWTFNQGQQNEELFTVLSDAGEVLVYSGDYPDSANWTIIAKARIPKPLGRQPFVKVAGDTFIITERGMIPMSSILAGNANPNSYYSISRKIKNQTAKAVTPVADSSLPFLLAVDSEGLAANSNAGLYVMNYERGAWSRLTLSGIVGEVTCLGVFNNKWYIGTSGSNSTPTLYAIDPLGYASASTTYAWSTGNLNFGSPLQKNIKLLRVLGINYGASSNFKNSVTVAPDFGTTGGASAATTAATDRIPVTQELSPPSYGRRHKFQFSRAGTAAANEKNEIQGFEVFYETGGVY